jgi:hypothetical protein
LAVNTAPMRLTTKNAHATVGASRNIGGWL